MPRQDLQFISDVFVEAVETSARDARIRHGMQLRAEMMASIAEGKAPVSNYRTVWLAGAIERAAKFIVEVLCKEFDEAHPDDKASSLDVTDISRGAHNRLVQAINKS